MSDLTLRVSGLGKRYRLGESGGTFYRYKSLRDTLGGLVRRPVRTLTAGGGPDTEDNSFWALKDVDFEVKQGEVVGIIGRNGAGKSTLLKILSRITKPTTGRIDLYGRVGSLLEVGTGFHPELSGRENVYLNGAILGMTRAEVTRKFDEIVAFSEIERFLDTPVKQYSSGMYTRLAFAVAAHLEPEILVVDEVLAVGDAAFQKKCLGKMKDVAGEGRTVLFVSHNMAAVTQLCSLAVVLKAGRLEAVSHNVATTVRKYLAQTSGRENRCWTSQHGLTLYAATINSDVSQAPTNSPSFAEPVSLCVELGHDSVFRDAALVARVYDAMDHLVATACTVEEGLHPFEISGRLCLRFPLGEMPLTPGDYRVAIYVYRPNDGTEYLAVDDACRFEVLPAIVHDAMWPYRADHGVFRLSRGVERMGAGSVA